MAFQRRHNDPGSTQEDFHTSVHSQAVVCQIEGCGAGDLGAFRDGTPFIACPCGYPVCRACYEFERREGAHVCPGCEEPYLRHDGSPWVPGDPIEDPYREAHGDGEARFVAELRQRQAEMDATSAIGMPPQPAPSVLSMSTTPDAPFNPNGHQYAMYENAPGAYAQQQQQQQHPHFGLITDGQVDVISLTAGSDYQNAIVGPPGAASAMFVGGDSSKAAHRSAQEYAAAAELHAEARPLVEVRHEGAYGFGSIAWSRMTEAERLKMGRMNDASQAYVGNTQWGPPKDGFVGDAPIMDESRQPLSRKVNLPSWHISPYRCLIVLRLLIIAAFLRWRLLNPVKDAIYLWIASIVCEIWFAISWIFDQFPKWSPINRETYLDRLALRFDREGASELAAVDIFVSTVDPLKEPVLVTANTLLSILAMDYPQDKLAVYLSDDGGAFLTFNAVAETATFALKWVPFAKRYKLEPRAPDMYFHKQDYLKDAVDQAFIKERREMKREYEEFKVRINARVKEYQNVPDEGWTMADNTPWPGNNSKDHPGMIMVHLGPLGPDDESGGKLPRLVYVSREKRPGYNHHKKAGAMNSLVRVSAVLTNAPYILNLDCDHYVNNSAALREAMCFMMEPSSGKKICYVQFPQRFDGIDRNDRYANHNTVFFDINLRGLDGAQGPVYVGTGCCFRRHALYGYEAPRKDPFLEDEGQGKKKGCLAATCGVLCCCCRCCCGPKKDSREYFERGLDLPLYAQDGEEVDSLRAMKQFERRFGPSPVFVLSTFHEEGGAVSNSSLELITKEAIHVISCGYEDGSDWGKELGWIYGSVTEDILTGFKMHVRGWRSVYCQPKRPAFKGSAPINLSDRLNQVLRWALGSVEIGLSKFCPIWYGYGKARLKPVQRLAYINTVVYPFTSFPLVVYCTLPAVCFFTNKFIVPSISTTAALYFLALFGSIFLTGILEMKWAGVGMDEWWRNEQFWVIGGVSSHLYAVFQGLLKVLGGVDTNFTVTSKQADDDGEFAELYLFKYTSLLIPPTALVCINILGIVAGIADAINNGVDSWGSLFGKLLFAFWVIVHLYPFVKGLMGGRQRTPTLIIVWAVLLASIFSLLWVKVDPFLQNPAGPSLSDCGVRC